MPQEISETPGPVSEPALETIYVAVGSDYRWNYYRILPQLFMIEQVGFIDRDGGFVRRTTDNGERVEFWTDARAVERGDRPEHWDEMRIVTPCDCPRHQERPVFHET